MAVTDKERKLAATLSDPVLWGQAYLYNRDGSGRDYWPHQVEDLRCPAKNIIHLDGRDVGKSIVLSTDALHYAFTTRGGQGLIAAPHQGHLDTIIEEIEFQLDTNPDLMNSIALTKYGKPKIHRKPYFRLEFTNGSVLYFRPAGAYGDAFRSLHVGRVWVDEGAWLTERAWKALRQCLKAGETLRIYSTPNGLRDPGTITVLKGNKPLCLRIHRQHRVVLYASDDAFIDFAVDFDPGWRELEVPPMTMLTIRHADVRAVENSEFRFIPQERKGTLPEGVNA